MSARRPAPAAAMTTKPMSETKLGQLIDSEGQRDAIHIAVAPVVANEKLTPGQHIGFVISGNTEKVGPGGIPIGIVDPFLKKPVAEGQKFWMVLYPSTITGLRHEWKHPAFQTNDSEKWLRAFAAVVGLTYEQLLKGADDYQKDGEVLPLTEASKDYEWSVPEKFWDHYRAVTGKETSEDGTIFQCCPENEE